nr:immunoglobulin heavy chain junction region [Macaca mulatta]MOV53844.1 immunoglobulin heavy chain junction region [Macaca mulatta]MOV54050.1 immunoglobulin heavy chain junction region [Macaca mulatta]MOV54926.1 immunoglobulin heavy chain junction region [Macaca mulatta]MOV59495.1 immunoglobulin heavy chain junction region [Macaca mulatta]
CARGLPYEDDYEPKGFDSW